MVWCFNDPYITYFNANLSAVTATIQKINEDGSNSGNSSTGGNLMSSRKRIAAVVITIAALIGGSVSVASAHDAKPVIYPCKKTNKEINLGTFSRKRARNLTSGTVMG